MASQPIEERRRGRTSSFKPEYVQRVAQLCDLGATDDEVADILGVHRVTIWRWKLEHPDFCNAIKNGKAFSDERTERSLYHKANGYYVTEQQAFKVKDGDGSERVEVVEVQKFIPPDTTAQIFWLKNRRSAEWRDKREVEGNIEVTSRTIDPRSLPPEKLELLKQLLLEASKPQIEGEFSEVDQGVSDE